jgi:hypothetical protein
LLITALPAWHQLSRDQDNAFPNAAGKAWQAMALRRDRGDTNFAQNRIPRQCLQITTFFMQTFTRKDDTFC